MSTRASIDIALWAVNTGNCTSKMNRKGSLPLKGGSEFRTPFLKEQEKLSGQDSKVIQSLRENEEQEKEEEEQEEEEKEEQEREQLIFSFSVSMKYPLDISLSFT